MLVAAPQGLLRASRHSRPHLSVSRWLRWGFHGCLGYGSATLPFVANCFQDEHRMCMQDTCTGYIPGWEEGGGGQLGQHPG